MATPDGFSGGEGVAADGERMTAVGVLNTVARVVTPWQALSDQELRDWDGDLVDYFTVNHDRHYGDPRKRPDNPWRFERGELEGQKLVAVHFGLKAGWIEAGALQWEHGLEQVQMAVYSGYQKREPTDMVLAILWELGGVPGLLGTADPVGDTYALDDGLFPEGWWMLRTMKQVFDREPRLLEAMAISEGGMWVRHMMAEVGRRLEAGDPVPAGWSYDY